MIIFIDSGVLGLLSNPNKKGKPIECQNWLFSLLSKGIYVVSSDICDYEVRRNLLLESQRKPGINSVNQLDELKELIDFLPVETEVLYTAAQIWAKARIQGQQTTNDYSLDADMIISAHWQLLSNQYPGRYVAIATTNVKHLSIFTEALNWESIIL